MDRTHRDPCAQRQRRRRTPEASAGGFFETTDRQVPCAAGSFESPTDSCLAPQASWRPPTDSCFFKTLSLVCLAPQASSEYLPLTGVAQHDVAPIYTILEFDSKDDRQQPQVPAAPADGMPRTHALKPSYVC